MITTTIDENNKEHSFVTQQYKVGLYVIIDSDPSQQFCSDLKEVDFHKKLREDYKFNPEKSSKL